MSKDNVFKDKLESVTDFEFNQNVADVFDDMLGRSVPFYGAIQEMIASLSVHFIKNHTNVYDLGCSTGTTLNQLIKRNEGKEVSYKGVDLSLPMLQKCEEKLKKENVFEHCELIQQDLNEGICIQNASLVLLNWTLQFVRPLYRDELIKQIYDGLEKNGCLLVVEKVLAKDSLLNRMYIDLYYDYKKKTGYSELEISQKREALENVLIPYRIEENMALLKKNGFTVVDVFFRWYNFAGFIGVKK